VFDSAHPARRGLAGHDSILYSRPFVREILGSRVRDVAVESLRVCIKSCDVSNISKKWNILLTAETGHEEALGCCRPQHYQSMRGVRLAT
jgi:hypothetical protein